MKYLILALILSLAGLLASTRSLAQKSPAAATCQTDEPCVIAPQSAVAALLQEAYKKGHAKGLEDCKAKSGRWT